MADHIQARFPEVELIEDADLRREVIAAIREGHEDGFWKAPAATTYQHHNQYCCNKHGLWIHTKMVFTAFERLHPTYTLQDSYDFGKEEADYGRAACLLHDLRKHGSQYNEGDSADKDHDIQCANWLADNTDLPEEVLQAVATHMGAWYDGPEPKSTLDEVVHAADMTAANKNVTCGIYKPHEDIRSFYPALPEADL